MCNVHIVLLFIDWAGGVKNPLFCDFGQEIVFM